MLQTGLRTARHSGWCYLSMVLVLSVATLLPSPTTALTVMIGAVVPLLYASGLLGAES